MNSLRKKQTTFLKTFVGFQGPGLVAIAAPSDDISHPPGGKCPPEERNVIFFCCMDRRRKNKLFGLLSSNQKKFLPELFDPKKAKNIEGGAPNSKKNDFQ